MIEAAINALLKAEAGIPAIVGDRIYPSTLPLTIPVPAVTYEIVSRVERTTLSSAEPTVHVRYRVQIDSHARDYDTLVSLVSLVRKALANKRGDMHGVVALTIRPEFQGMDHYDEDADIYTRATDVLATLSEPVS
jgi:hypothetical protein